MPSLLSHDLPRPFNHHAEEAGTRPHPRRDAPARRPEAPQNERAPHGQEPGLRDVEGITGTGLEARTAAEGPASVPAAPSPASSAGEQSL